MSILANAVALLIGAQTPPPTGVGAEGACLRYAIRLFPEFATWFASNRQAILREQGISPAPVLPELPAIGIPMDFRFTEELGFVATFPNSVRDAHSDADLTCIGDMGQKRLTSIRYKQLLRRPAPGEIWSF